ncbi:MAG: barstar family protein [Phycisphaerae bacterium]
MTNSRFRFFDGYGRNGDAWIDCMTDLHGPNSLSGLALPTGEPVEIVIKKSASLVRLHPEIFNKLVTLVHFANERYAEMNERVRITVVEM